MTYEIDLDKRTCTCPAYRKRPSQPCKHLRSVEGLFPNPPSPNPNEALSALIKHIRLRRVEDAVVWLLYLWRSGSTNRARAQRRLLIAAGEDNLSIPVMQSASGWYSTPARFNLHAAVREVIRIMKTPNWYATPDGRTYIRQWREAELRENCYKDKPPHGLLLVIERAVQEKKLLPAIHAFNTFYQHRDSNRRMLAQLLTRLSLQADNRSAIEIAELFEDNLRHLWNDANYSGQALYALIVGPVGEQILPSASDAEGEQLIENARARQNESLKVEAWCLDGVHVPGHDARFSGRLKEMAVACTVFEKVNRLDPRDCWEAILDESDGG